MAQARKATLVVIEFGASWPRWLHPSQSGDMAVVAQHYPGAPSSLVTQVASRVTRLESMGWQLSQMVFVSNGQTDRDASASRSVLVRGLLARLRDISDGAFVMTCCENASGRAARELIALGRALDSVAVRTGVRLSVHAADGALQLAVGSQAQLSQEALARAS